MPLFLKKNDLGTTIALWQITEPEAWFLAGLELTVRETEQLAGIKGRKRVEWLAVRYLTHELSGMASRSPILKDDSGKPYLAHEGLHLSISHSGEIAAAMLAQLPVGIDIQRPVEKIERIAHKFLRPEEAASLSTTHRLLHLHVYWGAKEVLYKAYGRRELDFRAHIAVKPFHFEPDGGGVTGKVEKEGFVAQYDLRYELVEGYVLVYGVERSF
ncbi:MAG: 4'-phosphopantetheinyl transferase superfamily protein [Saprospiraceae bacterium]|nr:4'-phosphopantetheinyl transferase superfamily protein [Saprospiraceae bacterium]MDZ4704478.1 4'-phosphopantetheinyl transferase superfamily protein [Saprospiraceae bacterium]